MSIGNEWPKNAKNKKIRSMAKQALALSGRIGSTERELLSDMYFNLAVGPEGSGHTTLFDLVSFLSGSAGSKRILHVELNDIVTWGLDQDNKMGHRLSKWRASAENGESPPDALLVEVMLKFIIHTKETSSKIDIILLSGTLNPQLDELFKAFSQTKLVHLAATEEESIKGVTMQTNSVIRTAAHSLLLTNSWRTYRKIVLPALDAMNSGVLTLSPQEPLHMRLQRTVDHLALPHSMRQTMKGNLHRPGHLIHRRIRHIDRPTVATRGPNRTPPALTRAFISV
jgi:hypothetical protein